MEKRKIATFYLRFGIGNCLAMILSYLKWGSVLWTILHGLLGWIYVIYYLIKY